MNILRTLVSVRPREMYWEYSRRCRDRLRGETAETYFDIHNPDELNPVLASCEVEPLRYDPAGVADQASATRFVLALLSRYSHVRKWFPAALSAGLDGPFTAWIRENGASRLGLSRAGMTLVTSTLASHPGEKGKRVLEVRRDLRSVFPFGLTPFGRGEFLAWMLRHGTRDLGFTPEEALWFLFEQDEAPDRGLAATYLVRPDWQQKMPYALSRFGWASFKAYLRREYNLRGRWFDRAKPPAIYGEEDEFALLRLAHPSKSSRRGPFGVNVLGHFRYPSGLQEAAAGLVTALGRTGVKTQCRDLPVLFPSDWTDRERYRGVELYDTSIVVAAANTFPDQFFPDAGLWRRPGVYRIANWYWELEEIPAEWVPKLGWADEVWAPTRFVAEAFRKVVKVPVIEVLPGVELPPFDLLPKSHFGLKDDRFTFLFTFDMHSTAARKNPLGVVEAFRRAFRQGEPVELVVKVSRGQSFPGDFAALCTAAEAAGATVINRVMPRGEVLGLMNAADCFVSLHRSEGLGLGLIESMLMGKPVIGTAYSGNLDFMTETNSYLVRAGRVPVTVETYAYPKGCFWGDPDLGYAAEQMRRVFDQKDESREIGRRAKVEMESKLSLAAYGDRVRTRLLSLRNGSLSDTPSGG